MLSFVTLVSARPSSANGFSPQISYREAAGLNQYAVH